MGLFRNICWLTGFLFLFQGISCQPPLTSSETTGRVVKVIDGDTYDILLNGKQVRVRMEGIDAPERGMDFYKVAKNYLGDLCSSKEIRLAVKEKDQYGRVIAKGFLPDGRELCEEMVKAGFAWHFTKYSNDPVLAAAEKAARSEGIGIWSMPNPVPPWEFRSNRRRKK